MRTFGRLLQILGLVLLPMSIVLELTGGLGRTFGVSDMLVMMVLGAGAFFVGRLFEGYAGG